MSDGFLPVSREELQRRGIETPDFVLITGDAYVDHPSFGAAIIGRALESRGYSVGVIAQPKWESPAAFDVFGRPRLGFLITGGNIDSMVCHYSVSKKKRDRDVYSPGGKTGLRPDRAGMVYANRVRELYKDSTIIMGGLEASLRRLAHYDYWDNAVRRSYLLDSSADFIVYGMGERAIAELADALRDGVSVSEITGVRGTVYKTKDVSGLRDYIALPDYSSIKSDKSAFCESFRLQYQNTDAVTAKALAEAYGNVRVVQNPPAAPLSRAEMDAVYALPFTRLAHPMYAEPIPAIEEVRFSIASTRGCFGSCAFCALTFHQGRAVVSRSEDSIADEAVLLTRDRDFKGYIHDVGGPTANFRAPACEKQGKSGACGDKLCVFPKPCKNLTIDHDELLRLLRRLRAIPKIKKVFIRSGLRYDYLIYDKNPAFLRELCEHHVSGQLKVAPEHVSDAVLRLMNKPGRAVYDRFSKEFYAVNAKLSKEQYLVPYLMSSHPGSGLKEAVELAEYIRDNRLSPEQVQDFYPTPGTLSTCMYYAEQNPLSGERVYVPKNGHEKAMQRALIQYRSPKNYELVKEALTKAGRGDLIGFGEKCLIRPRNAAKPSEAKRTVAKSAKTEVKGKKKTIRNIHKKKDKKEK